MAGLDIFNLPARFMPLAVASESSKASTPETDGARYPKRKRAEVKYYSEDDAEDSTDSETECVPFKRTRKVAPKKPLPPQKIFPFTSLPAELRNRIYEECFPDMPTLSEEAKDGEKGTIWFRFKQKAYRRSVEQFFPDEEDIENMEQTSTYRRWRNRQRIGGTQRGRPAPAQDSEDEEEMAGKPSDKKLGLNILALNTAIYNEAAPMVYRQRLVFADTVALMAFAAMLSPRTAKMIRHIEVRNWNLTRSRKSMGFTAMAMLAAKGVTNLEKLHINCSLGYFWSWSRNDEKSTPVPKRVARKIYRDCFMLLETIGRAKALEGESRWTGVDILEVAESNFESTRRWHPPPSNEADAEKENELANEMFKKELKRLLRPTLG